MGDFRNAIIIGASAGGIQAINKVISGFSAEMDIVVVVALHVSPRSNTQIIAKEFQRNTNLICKEAENGMLLKKGYLYIAPPELSSCSKRIFYTSTADLMKINTGLL